MADRAGEDPGNRGVIRLLAGSPDGRRVLARPNGLAGWTLPTVPVELPFEGWNEETVRRASEVLGAPIEPGDRIGPGAWSVTPTGRVPAAGRTWIGLEEADRLGADAAVVRAWARTHGPDGTGSPHGGESSG